MKDFPPEELETSRPTITCLEAVNFCLRHLFADQKHTIGDVVVGGLSFEELIGALLLARDLAAQPQYKGGIPADE